MRNQMENQNLGGGQVVSKPTIAQSELRQGLVRPLFFISRRAYNVSSRNDGNNLAQKQLRKSLQASVVKTIVAFFVSALPRCTNDQATNSRREESVSEKAIPSSRNLCNPTWMRENGFIKERKEDHFGSAYIFLTPKKHQSIHQNGFL